jgi:hypothetical protein
MPVYVGVVGSGDTDGSDDDAAERIGHKVAEAGGVLGMTESPTLR